MTKASRRIAELRRGIGALGTPNLGAIDEFTRVNTRYTFLTGQRDDILKAKRELTGIIADVTGEMEGIFTTQFQAIDQAFRQTFLELFGGGKAALVLEDPEHVLRQRHRDQGAAGPGKALSTLSLMSGGEMAFVAIALYFAILKVRPTPFLRHGRDRSRARRGERHALRAVYAPPCQEHAVSRHHAPPRHHGGGRPSVRCDHAGKRRVAHHRALAG